MSENQNISDEEEAALGPVAVVGDDCYRSRRLQELHVGDTVKYISGGRPNLYGRLGTVLAVEAEWIVVDFGVEPLREKRIYRRNLVKMYADNDKPKKPELKATNPKDAVGVRKVPFHVIPMRVIAQLGLALLEGARKYGSFNWRKAGVRASVYYDATQRHINDWWEGVDIDPDSGLSHIDKAIASLTVLRDSMMHGNWIDDRPIRAEAGWIQEANKKAAEIIDRYPDAKSPFTEKSLASHT